MAKRKPPATAAIPRQRNEIIVKAASLVEAENVRVPSVAIEDDFGAKLTTLKGSVDPGLDLEF